jgi:hypothetical protein
MRRVGSVGEKRRWLTQSVECRRGLTSPGLAPLGEEDEGQAGGQARDHHCALVGRLIMRALDYASDAVVRISGRPGRCTGRLRGQVGAILLARVVPFDVSAGDERFVRIDADDRPAGGVGQMRHHSQFADGAGVGIRFVDRRDVAGIG